MVNFKGSNEESKMTMQQVRYVIRCNFFEVYREHFNKVFGRDRKKGSVFFEVDENYNVWRILTCAWSNGENVLREDDVLKRLLPVLRMCMKCYDTLRAEADTSNYNWRYDDDDLPAQSEIDKMCPHSDGCASCDASEVEEETILSLSE